MFAVAFRIKRDICYSQFGARKKTQLCLIRNIDVCIRGLSKDKSIHTYEKRLISKSEIIYECVCQRKEDSVVLAPTMVYRAGLIKPEAGYFVFLSLMNISRISTNKK